MNNLTAEQERELRNKIRLELAKQLPEFADAFLDENDVEEEAEIANIEKIVRQLVTEYAGRAITGEEFEKFVVEIVNDFAKLGPLEPLLVIEEITEIMVNGPEHVWVEIAGELGEIEGVKFEDDAHVRRIIDRIGRRINRRCDEVEPKMDARLPDGSRVNCTIPPMTVDYPTITIRKFSKKISDWQSLLDFESLSPEMVEFLDACTKAKINMIISGGTGSGKTSTLNVISNAIPEDERIITIEDSAELQLHQDHVVRMESRPANTEGKGAITIRDCLVNALRMRPNRIVIGECRAHEAIDMLQAMQTGHDGSLTTVHANTPEDVFLRLETMCMQGDLALPSESIIKQMAAAIDLIVHISRMPDHSRKITYITAVGNTIESGNIAREDLFRYEDLGYDEDGRLIGEFVPCGTPTKNILDKFKIAGIEMKRSWFVRKADYGNGASIW